ARQAGAAICYAEHNTYTEIADITADFVYARLQKGDEKLKAGYPPKALDAWLLIDASEPHRMGALFAAFEAMMLTLLPIYSLRQGFTQEVALVMVSVVVIGDAALQLREGQPGNISGALQDCIAAGLPCVANQDLADNIFAPGYVVRVADTLDATEIALALSQVLETPQKTEAARRDYCDTYSMQHFARALLEII
ncbi:MAG: hypothetical protein B7Z81_07815, partial [Acidocella sp. 20-61-6]